jgi:hypothetical protein
MTDEETRAKLREEVDYAREVAVKNGAKIDPRIERLKAIVQRWLEDPEVKEVVHRRPPQS